MANKNKRLKQALGGKRALLVPGAGNALTARIIEDLGFEAIYLTGAGLANFGLGVPDIGLVGVSELVEATAAITDVTSLPLVVDGDTGFGNALNTLRTVRLIERAGASALQLEDQVFPKKCGHFAGKAVIPLPEMVAKLKAAVDARRDADFLIIARTDALAVEGIDAAIDRAHAFVEAGADVTFVEAPTTAAELARIARSIKAPQVANMVAGGGRTPLVRQGELAAMGFAMALYANAALQAAVKAMQEVLGALKRDGSLDGVADRLAGFAERQRVVDKDRWDALEAKYRS